MNCYVLITIPIRFQPTKKLTECLAKLERRQTTAEVKRGLSTSKLSLN